MINSELEHVKTLKEFNSEIIKQQTKAHGEGYNNIHKAIKKYLTKEDTYMELGVHQGGTASTAMLCNPKKMILVDIDFMKYNNVLNRIAVKYCFENKIDLNIKVASSIEFNSINSCDMLLIDSRHHPDHMIQELRLHGQNTNKYIVAHDTHMLFDKPNDVLYQVLASYTNEHPRWKIIERNKENVGYTVLKKS